MNVLWTKQKMNPRQKKNSQYPQMYSKTSQVFCDLAQSKLQSSNTQACGDTAEIHCCKICGFQGDKESFINSGDNDGHQDDYCQMIHNCFGIKTKLAPNKMVCEKCGETLKKINKFRILVQAAFQNPISSDNSSDSSVILRLMTIKDEKSYDSDSTILNRKPRPRRKKIERVELKKMNVPCTICGQKYLMTAPNGHLPEFVCSRCKSVKSNVARKKDGFLKRKETGNAKNELKGRNRLYSVPKKLVQQKNNVILPKNQEPLYKCKRCPNKYRHAKNLAKHASSVHGCTLSCLCVMCGKFLGMRKQFENHIQIHAGDQTKCDRCGQTLGGQKQTPAKHTLAHKTMV